MKNYLALGVLLLASCTVLAQSTQSSQSSGQSTGMAGMQMGPGQKGQGQGMSQMHQQHMKEMQADLQQMKSQIDKMRADAQKVQDANTKTALLDNADMWDQFVTRMQSHMQMMMQSGGMHHGGMGMQHKKSQPASGTQAPANPPQ
jgi:TolA-binding protein